MKCVAVLLAIVLLFSIALFYSAENYSKTLIIVNERTGDITSNLLFTSKECNEILNETKIEFRHEAERYSKESGGAVAEIIIDHEKMYDAMNPICLEN